MRLALLLWLCAGCHVVFLDEQVESSICGPYEDPTPVVFDPALPKLTHFSAAGDFALARHAELPLRTIALRYDAAGTMWIPDPARQANLDALRTSSATNLHYVSIISNTSLVGGQMVSGRYRVDLYELSGAMWTNREMVAFTTGEDVLPGGTLTTGEGVDLYRYHASAHDSPTDGKVIVIDVKPQMQAWRAEVATGGVLSTAAINETHAPTHGALALGRNGRPTLIYAASTRGTDSPSDLFVSERVSGRFQLGVELQLGGDGDELEPSTNADCTLLYFRRGDQILQARAR